MFVHTQNSSARDRNISASVCMYECVYVCKYVCKGQGRLPACIWLNLAADGHNTPSKMGTAHGTRDTGQGTRDTGHGTRDTGHGTRDKGQASQASQASKQASEQASKQARKQAIKQAKQANQASKQAKPSKKTNKQASKQASQASRPSQQASEQAKQASKQAYILLYITRMRGRHIPTGNGRNRIARTSLKPPPLEPGTPRSSSSENTTDRIEELRCPCALQNVFFGIYGKW